MIILNNPLPEELSVKLLSSTPLFLDSYVRLDNWIEKQGLRGYEPKDIYSAKIFVFLRTKLKDPLKSVTRKESSSKLNSSFRLMLSPFYQTKNSQLFMRKIFGIKRGKDPKAYSMFVRAYLNQYKYLSGKKDKNKFELERCKKRIYLLLDWLIEHRSPGYENFCWGYDYVWPHSPNSVWPKHTPQSTMVTYIGNVFLEAYYLFNEHKYKEVAISAGEFCLNNLNVDAVDKETICFSYSPLDKDHVINVNAHVGALLVRLYKLTNNKRYFTAAVKAFNYVVHSQNDNGSWYYRAPPEKYLGPADNYHTGDILEYIYTFIQEMRNDSLNKSPQYKLFEPHLKKVFIKGLDYYVSNFFAPSGMPKMSDTFTYPIDIHSSAQAMVSLCMIRKNKKYTSIIKDLPEKIGSWTIKNMQHSSGYFYHRIYNNGVPIKDKTPFLRWGQGEMLTALSFVIWY
ncbi:MAG: hypothetical protein WCV90_03955 [Candidatus Woesearchaeota archaeon]